MSIDKHKLNNRLIVENRRAYHNYEIIEKYEAGIELKGTEVKSVRQGKISIKEAYASFEGAELFVYHLHIAPYDHSGYSKHDPDRPKKLLLHKYELRKLYGAVTRRGFTIIPLKVYLKNGKVKVEIALCKGKKLYDKREDIKRRELEREAQREWKKYKF